MSDHAGTSSRPQAKRRLSLTTSTVLAAAGLVLFLEVVLPYVSMWVNSAESPHPVPAALALIYGLVFAIGAAVYVTSSDERLADFTGPIVRFLRDESTGLAAKIRRAVLLAVPLLVGFAIWRAGTPALGSPTTIRIQHPTMPGKYESLVNPFRGDGEGGVQHVPDEAVLREGTILYQTNCRPCHGVAAGGDGPMARFFRLRPADFRDPGYIATVVEPYAFWRVSEGGPGLPNVATPWDSAMPIWGTELTEEERWKVLLAEYATAGVEPRKPEKLE